MSTLSGYKDRKFELPLKVDVYRNLREGSMSVRARSGKHSGRVVAHMESVIVKGAQFRVRENGWRDVHDTGTKNVHAVIRGNMVGSGEVNRDNEPIAAMYNPKEYRYFVTLDEKPLESAEVVRVSSEPKIMVWNHEEKEDAVPYAESHL